MRRCQRYAELSITNRSRAPRCYSTDKSVVRDDRCRHHAPYPSMGFVPLQGTQPVDVSISLIDCTGALHARTTVWALDDIQHQPPPRQDNPFSTYVRRMNCGDGFQDRGPETFTQNCFCVNRVVKSVRLAVFRHLTVAALKPSAETHDVSYTNCSVNDDLLGVYNVKEHFRENASRFPTLSCRGVAFP